MSDIEREHMSHEVNNEISYMQNDIERDFNEHKVSLENIAEIIRLRLKYGENADQIQSYLTRSIKKDNYLHNSVDYRIVDVFGVFEVFGEQAPADADWYEKAIEAKGEIVSLDPEWDADLELIVITYAQTILNDEGNSVYTIYLKLDFSNITKRIQNMSVAKEGFGILFNSEGYIVAHKNQDFINKRIDSVNVGIQVFLDDFQQKIAFSEREMINYQEQKSITFFKLINNDLYLGVVMPKDEYYQNLNRMIFILIVFAILFLIVYIILSLHFIRAKEQEKIHVLIQEKMNI